MLNVRPLLPYAHPKRFRLGFSIFFTAIASLVESINPLVIGFALNHIGEDMKNLGTIDFTYIARIIIIMLSMGAFRIISEYLSGYLMADVVQSTMSNLRTAINRKLNHLPISYFDSKQQGDILGRLTNDVDTVGSTLQQGLNRIFNSSMVIIFNIIVLLYISPKLTFIIFIVLASAIFITKTITKISQPSFNKLQNILGNLSGFIQENYTGFAVIKLFNKQQDSIDDFQKINDDLYSVGLRSNFISALINPLIEFMVSLGYIGSMLLGFRDVLLGNLRIGHLISFTQYIWQVNAPIGQVTQLTGNFQIAGSSLRRISELLNAIEEQPDKEPYPIETEDIQGSVEFSHVAFGYSPKKMLMQDINLNIKSGQMVAIVGPTGAGKTTLINLLMRFYDVNAGQILIDGIDIKDMTRHQVRSIFGMVLQDPWLYHSSIRENIRFGKLDAMDYEIVEAAKLAKVDHFIRTLPEGYNTMINKEGSNVSQGQKQLMTIARVLIADPKIIILDEATSSVDTRLELLIQKAMDQVMKGRTSFIIAHRLSTIRDADLILVMNHGSIIEQGTHEELLLQNGMYKTLYESQFSEEV